jgi:hypothetical protein
MDNDPERGRADGLRPPLFSDDVLTLIGGIGERLGLEDDEHRLRQVLDMAVATMEGYLNKLEELPGHDLVVVKVEDGKRKAEWLTIDWGDAPLPGMFPAGTPYPGWTEADRDKIEWIAANLGFESRERGRAVRASLLLFDELTSIRLEEGWVGFGYSKRRPGAATEGN